MTNTLFFSVLIANYNNGKYLTDAINSVIAQSYPNWEIIIVDDCSTDNSIDIYKTLENDTRIKIFYNDKNQGCGYTKRRCVEKANGEICGFLDPDDVLTSNALSVMVEAHTIHMHASLIHSKLYYCNDKLEIEGAYTASKNVEPNQLMFFNLGGEISHFSTFKKKFYKQTLGIDSFLKKAVDQDLYLKLYEVGPTIYIDLFLYYYRIHKGGISSTEANGLKAKYWHWVANISAARRRNLNLEELYVNEFVFRKDYEYLNSLYIPLRKYSRIDSILYKIKKKLFR